MVCLQASLEKKEYTALQENNQQLSPARGKSFGSKPQRSGFFAKPLPFRLAPSHRAKEPQKTGTPKKTSGSFRPPTTLDVDQSIEWPLCTLGPELRCMAWGAASSRDFFSLAPQFQFEEISRSPPVCVPVVTQLKT